MKIKDDKGPKVGPFQSATSIYNIAREGQDGSTYYVTRTDNGEITGRTRILVPDERNLFFSRRKTEASN